MIDDTFLKTQHITQHFDAELTHLHQKVLKMMHLVLGQWELAIESLETANLDLAVNVVAHVSDVYQCASTIDQVVLTILARECPVAKDLRMVLSISKIAAELRYLSDEVCDVARLTLVLYEPRSGITHAQLLLGIMTVIKDIRNILANLAVVLGHFDAQQARLLLASDYVSGGDIQDAIARQLMFINSDQRHIKPVLIVMQIMKSLESSSDHCKDLAQYCILMIDGEDLRHNTRVIDSAYLSH